MTVSQPAERVPAAQAVVSAGRPALSPPPPTGERLDTRWMRRRGGIRPSSKVAKPQIMGVVAQKIRWLNITVS